MKKSDIDPSRRGLLRGGLALGAAALAAAGITSQAFAQDDSQKLAPSVVQYQETPKDGAQCSGCVNYIDPGACKIVSGKINPNGWCVAFAPKS